MRVVLEGCRVDLDRQVVWRGPEQVRLTTKEAQVLRYLADRPGTDVSNDELLREVWGFRGRVPNTRAPVFTVLRLRGKIEPDPADPRHLMTVHGSGYRFVPAQEATEPSLASDGPTQVWAASSDALATAAAVVDAIGRRGGAASLAGALPTGDGPLVVVGLPAGRAELADEVLAGRRSGETHLVMMPGDGRPAPETAALPLSMWSAVDAEGVAAGVLGGWRAEVEEAVASSPMPPPGAPYRAQGFLARGTAEAMALRLLHEGAPVVIHGPRGWGKTWMLRRVLDHGRQEGDVVVEIDLGAVEEATLRDPERLAWRLAVEIGEAVGMEELPEQRGPGPGRRQLQRFVERTVLPAVPGRLLLALDQADRLRLSDGSSDLFGLLRAWASMTRAPWDRLRLLLTLSTEPALLVDDPHLSPFNLSPPVVLQGLDRAAIREMAARDGLGWSEAEVEQLGTWLGGHPYLIRMVTWQAVQDGMTFAQVRAQALGGSGPLSDHLRSRSLGLSSRADLAAAWRAVAAESGEPDERAAQRLAAVGLVRREEARWVISAPIYLEALGQSV